MQYVAIMAGGVGSRFWPGSREKKPKQFMDILGVGKSLLRLTYERFARLVPAERIYVITNAAYTDLVAEQLPELDRGQILGEPSRNNTAPCIAYAAFKLHGLDPEASMVVAPSDQLILKEEIFLEKIREALAFSEKEDALVTLGIEPTRPDTGYGYIQYETAGSGVRPVRRFHEKPDLETAKRFLADGGFLWNAGIFVWKTSHVLSALRQHAPEIWGLFDAHRAVLNTSGEGAFLAQHYPTTPNISIDYAIMEKASNVYTLPADIGWSDLGTWASLYEISEKDSDRNAVFAEKALLRGVRDCIVRAPADKLVVIKDLENFILIDEPDVLLLLPKDQEQAIKQLTAEVKQAYGDRYL
jgi:mannose-1-phosphate guanylyltransferase